MPEAMGDEAVAVLQRLLRFDTVNPPGRERPAQEYVAGVLREAGLDVVLAGPEPERPNLVARLRGAGRGPSLGLLSHVDTVGADPAGWRHDPWSGDLADGCVWGRGALDMKSQTAAEVVAACALARSGRRLAGDVVVICVADEEVGGTGAEWLCEHRPDLVRCDFLLGEGDGAQTDVGGQRLYGVSVADKGVFRFTLTTEGAAGHASIPTIADNALLKLAPLLQRMADRRPAWDVTAGARALLGGLGIPLDGDPAAALDALREYAPAFAPLVEPMLRVTLAPTMAAASREYNVIPAEAQLFVDCRVPPGMEERAVVARVREVLGDDGYRMEFTETVTGNESPADSPLMDALRSWVRRTDPEATCLPTVSTGYSDSRTFRAAFGDLVAYGFFPHRHMRAQDVAALVHGRDERIDVRDLALAADCYRSVALDLLGPLSGGP
jgi:acetylornithine deacetylase/succinyl-diaminopimelate desuccinylase-like protein